MNQEARRIYEYLLTLSKDDSSYHNDIGLTHYREQSHSVAIEWFDKALELNSENLFAHHNKALANHAIKNYPEAEKGYHRAISCSPAYTWSFTNLARLLEDTSRYEESEQYHRLSTILDNQTPLFQENHANFLHRRSRYQEAIVHYDRSIELGATKHAINFEKGHCNIGIGNYREAISLWQQCTEDEPTNSQYHFNLGWIYQRTKSYEKALACYKKGRTAHLLHFQLNQSTVVNRVLE